MQPLVQRCFPPFQTNIRHFPRSDLRKPSRATKKSVFDFIGHCDSNPEVKVDPTLHGNHLFSNFPRRVTLTLPVGQMAWHSQGPRCRPTYFKRKTKYFGENCFKTSLQLKTCDESHRTSFKSSEICLYNLLNGMTSLVKPSK